MNDLTAIPRPRVALLIDGDNLSHAHAGALIQKAAKHGALTVKRVYGNMAKLPGWNEAHGLRAVHSGTGKNASDLLLAVDAMALMLNRQADILIIASSDGDFSHLAQHLTEAGHQVIGMGEIKTPLHFRKCCTSFHDIAPPTPIASQPSAITVAKSDPLIDGTRRVIAEAQGAMRVTLLSTRMSKDNAVQISQTPHKTWRAFLTAHPSLFDLDPKGPDAMVRLKA
jgi:uncharacterized LabA/DUF88 family protein